MLSGLATDALTDVDSGPLAGIMIGVDVGIFTDVGIITIPALVIVLECTLPAPYSEVPIDELVGMMTDVDIGVVCGFVVVLVGVNVNILEALRCVTLAPVEELSC